MKLLKPLLVLLPAVLLITGGNAYAQREAHNAVSECSICHLDRDGVLNLWWVHFENPNSSNGCDLCHVNFDFSATILGPLGTWDGMCEACHNPDIVETGNAATPTKGHRCIVCHGEQKSTDTWDKFHKKHKEDVNCVVCHGFIPDTGDRLSPDVHERREVCVVCHGERREASVERIHRRHVARGVSCEECHGLNNRPPVDTITRPSVCEICHKHRTLEDFAEKPEMLHRKHTAKQIDCGGCHAMRTGDDSLPDGSTPLGAFFQDDRNPMFPLDDYRRMNIGAGRIDPLDPTSRSLPCAHCHKNIHRTDDVEKVHEKHVGRMWQWCYNCHDPEVDRRPLGEGTPINTEPALACALCHKKRSFTDTYPFRVHRKHAERNKCYACHQTVPRLFDWDSADQGGAGYGWLDVVDGKGRGKGSKDHDKDGKKK
jgi:hypothetical protein